jgi:radical SAM protein with 4Fe4S-binding SPASM domain
MCSTQKPEAPCGAGKTFCSIDTEGNIYPCHRLMFSDREQTIGHIDTGVDEEKREFFTEYDMSNMYGDQDCSSCSNNNCKICIAANYESNKNMVIGFPKYCKMSKKEDEIRWATLRVLSDKGYAKVPESSCSCGGSCNHDDVVNKIADMYRPVFEELDSKFKKLDELNGHYVEAFKNVDAKADKAIKIAQDALALTGDLFKLIENMYKESNKK